ncbi:MAG: hypothetical protein V3V99_06075 [candidate division Zixibacteria bacterium]
MSSQYIPSGRTSIVKRGEAEFQLQTECAIIPHPRVTTTIFSKGQVLHKIERTIDKEVTSIEEMHEVEDIIKAQHLEVSKILREEGLPSQPASRFGQADKKIRSDQIRDLPSVEKVYLVTGEGKLVGNRKVTKEFKKMFKHVLRELPNMIGVFAELPGHGHNREEGIYEIELGRILLASTGVEFFLILLKPETPYDIIAPQISGILNL